MPAVIYYNLEDEVVQILSYGLRSKEISQFAHVSAAIVIQIITNSRVHIYWCATSSEVTGQAS